MYKIKLKLKKYIILLDFQLKNTIYYQTNTKSQEHGYIVSV
jgi:hypothetical protein